MKRTTLIVSLLAATALVALAAGVATAGVGPTAVTKTEAKAIGYCTQGTPQVNCLAYGCTGQPGSSATCGYKTCRVWSGFGCVLFA